MYRKQAEKDSVTAENASRSSPRVLFGFVNLQTYLMQLRCHGEKQTVRALDPHQRRDRERIRAPAGVTGLRIQLHHLLHLF